MANQKSKYPQNRRDSARRQSPPLPVSSGPAEAARLPVLVSCGRLASRLGFQAALLVTCATFCRELYRHFAHAKYYALWIVVSFGIVGAIAGWRRGELSDPSCARSARLFRFALLAVLMTWCLSLVFALNVGHGFEVLCRVTPLLAVAWWAAQRPLSWRRDVPRMVGLMLGVTALVLFLGLLQWDDFQTWLQANPSRASWHTFFTRDIGMLNHEFWLATLGNKNSAASFYAAALALMCGTVILDRSPTRRAIAVTLGTLLVIVIFLTTSRGGLVATGAGIAAAALVALQCAPTRHGVTPVLRPALRLLLIGAVVLIVGGGLTLLLSPIRRSPASEWEVGTNPDKLQLMGVLIVTVGGAVLTVSGLLLVVWHFLERFTLQPLMRTRLMRWKWSEWRRGMALTLRWGATIVLVLGVVLWIGWLVWLSGVDADRIQQHDEMWSDLWSSVFGGHGGKSFIERLYIWQSAARMVRDHPITGIGWGQFPLVYPSYTWPEYYDNWGPTDLITTEEAHSGHLNLTVETGLLGAAAWILLLGVAWFGAIRRMREASAGDAAARAALIWFPPAVAMAVHMSVDKFWAYPASLTIMMFGFGVLVRPRQTTGGEPVFRRGAGIVWGAGLVIALLAGIASSQLAAGSHALARGRQLADQAKAYRNAMVREIRATGRTTLTSRAEQVAASAEEALGNARTLAPWEIDSWSRSLDHALAMNMAEDSRSIEFLENAIRVAPNYFPVQRNYAAHLVSEAQRLRRQNPEIGSELIGLAEEMLGSVLSLKPTEINALYSLSDLLLSRNGPGDREEAQRLLEILVNVPRINSRQHPVLDPARVRLASLLLEQERYDEALSLMTLAGQYAVGINEIILWQRMTTARILLGRFDEAWQDLERRLENLSDDQRQALVSQAGADPQSVSDRGLLVIINLAVANPTRAMQIAAEWADETNADDAWGFAAVVARIVSENLAHQVIDIWGDRLPSSALRPSAEVGLFAE